MSKQKDNETKPTEQKGNLTQRSKMILETSIDGFCVVGVDGKLLEVNSSLCDITGYSKEELLRMKIIDIEAAETRQLSSTLCIELDLSAVVRQIYLPVADSTFLSKRSEHPRSVA